MSRAATRLAQRADCPSAQSRHERQLVHERGDDQPGVRARQQHEHRARGHRDQQGQDVTWFGVIRVFARK